MDAQRTVGLNVRHLRVARGLSQERLAFEAGVDRSYVGRIERGSENISIRMMETLAKALGVEVQRLLDPIDPTMPARPSMPAGRKPKGG